MKQPTPSASLEKTKNHLQAVLTLIAVSLIYTAAQAQDIRIDERFKVTGVVERVDEGMLHLRRSSGEALSVKIQDKSKEAILLESVRVRLRFPATIQVKGVSSYEDLLPGQIVHLETEISRTGRTRGEVTQLQRLSGETTNFGVEFLGDETEESSYRPAVVIGEVARLRRQRLQLNIVPNDAVRKDNISVSIADEATVSFESDQLDSISVGDAIVEGQVAKLSTGDLAFEKLVVEVTQKDPDAFELALQAKYRRLSDAPSAPRDVRSQHFVLHTDVSDRQAQILLDKLEHMLGLISQYYGRMTPIPIECYVVRDLSQWPQGTFDQAQATKISRREGVTISQSLRGQTRSIVFSCDSHGIVQHEAVHAYCAQAFGSPGPTWYAEGMAEMGQYWRDDELAVRINPLVVNYLETAEPKKLLEIVAAGQITGDSWQAYAWRWALCHLLANNPNYSDQFKVLGMAMMSGKEASFESVYGPVANQISFEYDFFVEHLTNGYRVDLCAWDWQSKIRKLKGNQTSSAKIIARRGWQGAGISVEQGETYSIENSGSWSSSPVVEKHGPEGDSAGRGKLVGILLNDFQLSDPFPIGNAVEITMPAAGLLYLRMEDAWDQLDDNEGTIELEFSLAK